jgi:malate/lactate dehydrogenase
LSKRNLGFDLIYGFNCTSLSVSHPMSMEFLKSEQRKLKDIVKTLKKQLNELKENEEEEGFGDEDEL